MDRRPVRPRNPNQPRPSIWHKMVGGVVWLFWGLIALPIVIAGFWLLFAYNSPISQHLP